MTIVPVPKLETEPDGTPRLTIALFQIKKTKIFEFRTGKSVQKLFFGKYSDKSNKISSEIYDAYMEQLKKLISTSENSLTKLEDLSNQLYASFGHMSKSFLVCRVFFGDIFQLGISKE